MTRRTGRILAAATTVALGGAWVSSASGQTTYTWVNGTSGSWASASDWTVTSGSGSTFPVSGDTADFGTGASANAVTVTGTQAVNTINFSDTVGTTISGGTIDIDAGGAITRTTGWPGVSGTNKDIMSSAIGLGGNLLITNDSTTAGAENAGTEGLQITGNITGVAADVITITDPTANGFGVLLSGNNSGFAGNIQVNSGILALGSTTAASSSNTITLGTTAGVGGADIDWSATGSAQYQINGNVTAYETATNENQSGGISIATGNTFTISAGANSVTLSGHITTTGTGTLSNTSTGTLTLSGVVTNAGTITSSAGTLTLNGFSSITNTGTISVTGGTANLNAATINNSGGLITTSVTTAANASVISGTTGNITVTAGVFTFNGANSNTFSGNYNANGGTLQLNRTGGSIAVAGPLNIGAGLVTLGASSEIVSTDVVNFTGAGTLELKGFTQTLGSLTSSGSFASTINDTAAANGTLTLDLQGGTYNYTGKFINGTGTGLFNLAVEGTGTETISGAGTAYSGTTSVSGGTLIFSAANAATVVVGATSITGGTLGLTGAGTLGNTPISVSGTGIFAPTAGTSAGGTITTGSNTASISLTSGGTFDMTGDNGNTLGTFTLHGSSSTALSLNDGTLKFDIGNNSLTSHDLLAVGNGGSASVTASFLSIDTNGDSSLALGDYTLITAAGGLGSNFEFSDSNAITDNIVVGGTGYTLSLGDSTATSEKVTVALTVVPEPTSLGLLGIAAAGLIRRRRRNA